MGPPLEPDTGAQAVAGLTRADLMAAFKRPPAPLGGPAAVGGLTREPLALPVAEA
jgi:hypothetical protein